MINNPFQTTNPFVHDNNLLRTPQREAYTALETKFDKGNGYNREVGIVLPVGCGKSGCIALAPFAYRSCRTLVVAPNVKIAQQLMSDFNPTNEEMFYSKCNVICGPSFPEPAEIRGRDTNFVDLEEAHVVITNIQQLQGEQNKWLQGMDNDFFDLILFDEGHHNVAPSWDALRQQFPSANIVSFSATPRRADGRRMKGPIIYSYPVFRAIREGYVKSLSARVLNPSTLRYIRKEDDREVEVELDEVRRLGEEDADFRRSILTSKETLDTIVDASIRALNELRKEASNNKLKIIASALNYRHCIEIVESYRSRGVKANYVHSRQESAKNDRVQKQLNNHELDVIVQVRKLGEGFDHPYLAVAAVFSIFTNLSPFVQFVGRIMRVIKQNAPNHLINRGIVVFHAGANVAHRWEDFREFSEADCDFYDQLLPLKELNFSDKNELQIIPRARKDYDELEVLSQGTIEIHEISLLQNDEETMDALRGIRDKGYTSDQVLEAYKTLSPVPKTRQLERRAKRLSLDEHVKNEVGGILHSRDISPMGYELDTQHRKRTNYVVLKSAIDRRINDFLGRSSGERDEFTISDIEQIFQNFPELVKDVISEIFDGTD